MTGKVYMVCHERKGEQAKEERGEHDEEYRPHLLNPIEVYP